VFPALKSLRGPKKIRSGVGGWAGPVSGTFCLPVPVVTIMFLLVARFEGYLRRRPYVALRSFGGSEVSLVERGPRHVRVDYVHHDPLDAKSVRDYVAR